MKLGIDVRCLQTGYRTGVGEYVWQIINQLVKDKTFQLAGFANALGKRNLPKEICQAMTISEGRWPNKIMNFILWQRLGQGIDERLIQALPGLEAIWLPNPGFINVSARTPAILTIHDLSFIHYPRNFPNKGRWWYFPAVKKLLSRGLAGKYYIACVSQHTADDLQNLYPKLKTRIKVVPPGLDEIYFTRVTDEQKSQLRLKYNLPQKFFLSLGTIEPRKNYRLLLEAYDQAIKWQPDLPYDLVIAGAWGWKYNKLISKWRSSPNSQRIRFIDYIDQEDKPVLYQSASLFLFPSFYEGIGLPVLEAMASARPVVATNKSSVPELVGRAGWLVSPYLKDAWTKAMLDFSSQPSSYDSLAKLGEAQAAKFSWAKTAQTYKNLFEEIILS